MTVKKTEAQLAKAATVKAIRTAVRLKHALEADAELNEILPVAEKAFDEALNRGVLPEPGDILRQVGVA